MSSTAGWRSRKRAIASGMIVAPALGNAARRRRPAAQAGDRLELGLGVGQPREDRVGVLDERAAGVGQAHAARVALDEAGAGLALERGDLLGDGGLRVGERVGRGGERPALGDLAQHAHAANVEHKPTLSVGHANVICAHGCRRVTIEA